MRLLEEDSVSRHNRFVESQPRLRAVPLDELADCVVIRPLRTDRRQAVQDGPLGLFKIGKLQY